MSNSEILDRLVESPVHRVSEYWMIDPSKRSAEKYLLHQGEYLLEVKLSGSGLLQSTMIEGFSLQLEELFE